MIKYLKKTFGKKMFHTKVVGFCQMHLYPEHRYEGAFKGINFKILT